VDNAEKALMYKSIDASNSMPFFEICMLGFKCCYIGRVHCQLISGKLMLCLQLNGSLRAW
jgi:hypothetical protein